VKAQFFMAPLIQAGNLFAWHLLFKHRDIGNRIPVLCYHRVLPDLIEGRVPLYTVLPEQFEAQMAFLAAADFNSLSLEEYAEIARGRRPLVKRGVLVTFDDGYADNYAMAWPIAQKYQIKINLFICTGSVGQAHPIFMAPDGYAVSPHRPALMEDRTDLKNHLRHFPHLWRPLTWEEIRKMQHSGVEIGFHSHRHRKLALLPPEEIATDIATGLEVFARELGYRPKFFALPYGWYDSYTPEVIRTLQRFNLQLIFATHLDRAPLPSDAWIFPRIVVLQQDNLATFQRKLFGAHDWPAHLRRLKNLTQVLGEKPRPW